MRSISTSFVVNVLVALVCGACNLPGGVTRDDAARRARVYMRGHEDTLVAHLDSATVKGDGEYWRVQFRRREKGEFPAFRSILVHKRTGAVVPQLDR
jgi:hypothetical protein